MPVIARYDVGALGLTPDQEEDIASRLRDGALVIYPTDTLYAIGCCALDRAAVAKLREAKGREAYKALPVIVSDLTQARLLTALWPGEAQLLADAFWPGALTLVVPAARTLPSELLAGANSVAVRVPGLEIARTLARLAGPLVATSANLAGEAPCVTVDLAIAAFPLATLAIDIGPLDGAPSTIVDLTDPTAGVRLLREGRINRGRIEGALGQGLGPD